MGNMATDNHRTTRSQSLVMYLFGIFMLLFYLGMAYLLLFSKVLAERMSPTVRYVMGGVFLIYGLFRLYRQVRVTNQDDE